MSKEKKHKHMKGGEFKFTGKYVQEDDKVVAGETLFVKKQYEQGIAGKLKNASNTSLFRVHGKE